MKISDIIAGHIMQVLKTSGGNAEIQRNELAIEIGCVPSQINYVLTSRFTPEQGYIVRSRRGGGGYIRITRISTDKCTIIMHVVNSIGDQISTAEASAIISSLRGQEFLTENVSRLIESALSDRAYSSIPLILRDALRASIFKNMLITQI